MVSDEFSDGLRIGYENILDIANGMINQEREQVNKAYLQGLSDVYTDNMKEDYYKKTYGDEKQTI